MERLQKNDQSIPKIIVMKTGVEIFNKNAELRGHKSHTKTQISVK